MLAALDSQRTRSRETLMKSLNIESSIVKNVRLVPDISAAAFRQKRVRELALWYCLRTINTTGSGKLDLQRAISELQAVFNYSQRTIYAHLRLGEGMFWTISDCSGRTRIDLQSLNSVVRSLGIGQLTNCHFTEVNISEFDSSTMRNSQIYASIHHPQGIKLHPISREAIQEFTGCTKNQQRRLEKTAKVRRFANYAVHYNDSTGYCDPLTMQVISKSRISTIQRRLPNSYQSKQQPGSIGCLRNTARLIRSSERREASVLVKVFFNTYKSLVKALGHRRQVSTAYARVSPGSARVRGRQEWSLCMN